MATLTQAELNHDMTTLGIGRYRSKVERAKSKETESETAYSQRLLRGVLPAFIEAIDIQKDKWSRIRCKSQWQIDLLDMPSDKLGYLTVKTVLDQISMPCKMTALCVRVGTTIDYQRRSDHLAKSSIKGEGIILGAIRKNSVHETRKHVRKGIKRDVADGLMEDTHLWKRKTSIGAGLNLIELLKMSTGLIEYRMITDTGHKKPTRYVVASTDTLKWVEKFNSLKELALPFWMPAVEKPVDWTGVWEGGYRTQDSELPRTPFIKTADRKFLDSVGFLETPMEACNLIQSTPWQVNEEVLDVMQWAWKNSLQIGNMPNRELEEIPTIPTDYHTNKDSNLAWRVMASGIHKRNMGRTSQRLRTSRLLFLIEKMRGNTFYFPSNCDFRGRIYNIPSLFNVQGTDLSRGTLKFARSKPINTREAYKWLAVQGANTWGYDKATLDDRVKWADDFAKDAIRIAANPTGERLWTEADEPWQFLAWCFEWATLKSTGKLDSHLPVHMDATNNGIQILSMLTRDTFGMKATNVLPTKTPADIYALIAKLAEADLRKQAEAGSALLAALIQFGIDRKTTKKSVMCYSYGMTQYSNRKYIADWYDDQIQNKKRTRPFDDSEKYIAVHLLSKAIRDAIESVLDHPKQCMKWFQDCTAILTKAEHPLAWVTPSGFPVRQEYYNYMSKQIKTWISGKATHVRYFETSDELSKSKQRNGISPNFVHSLDAAALHNTIIMANKGYGIEDFAMIHDSYATHAANCENLGKCLRSVFVEMFSVDLLRDWKQQQESATGVELPEPPEYGTADISQIYNSTYFFS